MTDPRNDISAWLDELVDSTRRAADQFSAIHGVVARSLGKSAFEQLYMQRPRPNFTLTGLTAPEGTSTLTVEKPRKTTERAAGVGGLAILLDEMDMVSDWWVNDLPSGPALYTDDVRAEFRDAEFPEADTFVVLEKLDKKDPRHPNPAAGDSKRWFVKQGVKKVQVKNLTLGKRLAEKMHRGSITAIQMARELEAERIRLAHEEELRIAAANDAHLKAHPAFGDF